MDFNLATTVSFCAAATCGSLAALGAYLGQAPESRHFRYAAAAAVAGSVFCVTDAVIAGRLGTTATIWGGRIGLGALTVHSAAWVAFLAAWDRRPLSRLERVLVALSITGGLLCLVPGLAALDTFTERTLAWTPVTYRDPDPGPLGSPIMAVAYVTQVSASVTALRMSRHNPKARIVAAALALFCIVAVFDWLSSVHVLHLPYIADSALALAFISVGSVVMRDAAASAAKSAELERARVAMAEGENLAALGELAAVVAHEVRNPVAIIFGALAGLQRTARSEEDAKLLGIVGEEADRLKQLVTRLLDAVRPFELQYSRCDARRVVRHAIAQVTASSGIAPENVELVAAPDEEVECDEVLLGQAISNLVQNALVASGRRSPVRVRATVNPEARPTSLCIQVADDGDGVPVEARPRLFTPFFTTRATGTGLGLALVKRIVGAHGGTVGYEPGLDGGASFVMSVPLRREDGSPGAGS